jgi:hypothetical protein
MVILTYYLVFALFILCEKIINQMTKMTLIRFGIRFTLNTFDIFLDEPLTI